MPLLLKYRRYCWLIVDPVPLPLLLKYQRQCFSSPTPLLVDCRPSTAAIIPFYTPPLLPKYQLTVGPIPPPLYPFTRCHCCSSTSWLLAQYCRHYTLLHAAIAAQVPVDCWPSTAAIIPFYTLPLLLKITVKVSLFIFAVSIYFNPLRILTFLFLFCFVSIIYPYFLLVFKCLKEVGATSMAPNTATPKTTW